MQGEPQPKPLDQLCSCAACKTKRHLNKRVKARVIHR
jgi:hypothetical protein